MFEHFTCRWMICLLIREFPIRFTLHLWDTYIAHCDQIDVLHVYVCAAFLSFWRDHLIGKSFTECVLFLQNLKTNHWVYHNLHQLFEKTEEIYWKFQHYWETCRNAELAMFLSLISVVNYMFILTSVSLACANSNSSSDEKK
eukprot:TRINITY_DN4331_c0_g1_i1.p1 TRINITY_DN4331_c0_g1~~TRINITY_DN4331_c0_g1_i1.p1  ORF type:complete len:142 (-),score=16.70 TRINITY_DN4331_c0_g1_i1:99-524(-)